MIAYSSNCLISQEWLASIAEGDSIINATLLYFTNLPQEYLWLSYGVELTLPTCLRGTPLGYTYGYPMGLSGLTNLPQEYTYGYPLGLS